MRRRLATLCLAALPLCAAPAQDRAPQLRTLGWTHPIGGPVTKLVIARDGRHMLSAGACGDLCAWDLPARRLLHRVPPFADSVVAIALHPREPFGLFAIAHRGWQSGAVFALDLATGATTLVCAQYADDLCFTAAGDRCAIRLRGQGSQQLVTYNCTRPGSGGALTEVTRTPWVVAQTGRLRLTDGPAGGSEATVAPTSDPQRWTDNGTFVASPDGRQRGVRRDRTLARFAPTAKVHDLANRLETDLCYAAIADDGTFVASDEQGQIHVQGRNDGDLSTLAGHQGTAQQLAWSPDSRFLAVAGLGGVRIVDRQGRVIADRAGTQLALAGPQGAEFWFVTPFALHRWDAASGQELGTTQHPATPRLPLLRTTLDPIPWGSRDLHRGLTSTIVVGEQPWVLQNGAHSAMLGMHDGTYVELPIGATHEASAGLGTADGGVLLIARERDDTSGTVRRGQLVRIDRAGQVVARTTWPSAPRWLADAGDGSSLLVGTLDGTTHRVQADTLAELTSAQHRPALLQVAPLDDDHLLGSTGRELHRLAPTTLEVVDTFALPAGLPGIRMFALAPDRKHLAIACLLDVYLVAIE